MSNATPPNGDTHSLVTTTARRGNRMRLRVLFDRPSIVTGLGMMSVVVILVVIGPIISGHGVYEIEPPNRYAPPSGAHWFGTDSFGRDVFTRVTQGGRNSLMIGALVALISAAVGTFIGLYCSMNRIVDAVFMRISDGLISFPAILLAMVVTLALGQSNINVAIALSIVFTPMVARVIRSRVLVEKELTYVEVLRAQGTPRGRILWLNILPNVLAPLTVQATYIFGEAIIIEAGLSFVGAGVPLPEPSWGSIVYEGRSVLESASWLTLAPAVLLALTVLATAFVGDGIRDAFDPSFMPAGVAIRFRRWAKERRRADLPAQTTRHNTVRQEDMRDGSR